MKRFSLMTVFVCGVCFAANAGGWCRTGSAVLNGNGDGTSTLSCPNNGTCYGTDNSGLVTPGHDIYIHLNGKIVTAKVIASDGPNHPPTGSQGVPTDQLPSNVVVQMAK